MAEPQDPTEPQTVPGALIPTPLVRRNFPAAEERPTLPPDIEAQFNQLNQAVQALSVHFLGQNSVEAQTDSSRERGPRRIKKFHRAGGDEATAETVAESVGGGTAESADNREEADSLARNKHIAWPKQNPAEGMPGTGVAFPQWWRPSSPEARIWLRALVGGLLLLGLGLIIGRALPVHPTPGVGKRKHSANSLFGPAESNEQALATADEALHAEHTGNADAARKLYETAVNKRTGLPGANYRLALLALQRNDREEAGERLERSVLEGEEVPTCCYLLARIAADQGDLDEQAAQFEAATHARPLDGKYLFFYAEILRRQGKPQAAIVAFDRALDRPYTAADGDLYLFKERLAKLEYGRDDTFNAELTTHLKQEPVGGDWLLLAAAQNFDRQEFAAAADRLRQAANRLPSGAYADLTHDYFFQTHAKRPEVSALLNRVANPIVSSAGPTVLDPATWSPQRADPAVWPLASAGAAR